MKDDKQPTNLGGDYKSESIVNVRAEISQLDRELLSLLSKRRDFSKMVAEEKQKKNAPLRDQQRERQLLESLIEKASYSGLDSHYVTSLFNTIIEDSIQFQQNHLQRENAPNLKTPNLKDSANKSLAVLGGKGAYSYLAAKKYFANSSNTYLACSTFEKVILSVEREKVDFGVIPIENTTSGAITEVYDLLLDSRLTIVGEEKFPINHCLVAKPKIAIEDIEQILAHTEASKQCNKNLSKLISAKMILVPSTAHALQQIADSKNNNLAAIASEQAAALFGLQVLVKNIADQSNNTTRFLVLAKNAVDVSLSVKCKTSLALSTGQQPGSLAEVLGLFRNANIPLTRLESRPIPNKSWQQMFYIDFEGNIDDTKVEKLLESLSKLCSFLRVLGSYQTDDIDATQVPPESLAKVKIKAMESVINRGTPIEENTNANKAIKTAARDTSNYPLASREHKPSDTLIRLKDTIIGGESFTVIAGPHSVESEQQILSCAKHANESGVAVLSGGCFMTNAALNCVQRLGYTGLDYLKKAGEKYSLPIIAEVTDVEDVKQIAQQADALQIGARNMQNFSLLKAVGKTNIPVMLKRGIMATIDELLNAANYILQQGNLQVFLCEGGIRTFDTATSSTLDLSAVPLLKQLTHLPIMVDPSSAAGASELVTPLVKAAKAVGAHGVMMEFHPNPKQATSGGERALDYSQLTQVMKDLYGE